MKKIFCVLLYLPLIFSSCKEEEKVIVANDIIVGDWIIYHKEVTGSDSTLSFAENYDLETISLSVKSDYTWTFPYDGTQPEHPWDGLNAGGSWYLQNNYYYFENSDINNGWTNSFYCSNNIMKLSTGGYVNSPADKLIYYFQRDGYDFSDCNEVSYLENP